MPAIALVWGVVVAVGVVPIGLGAVPQAVAEDSSVTKQGPPVWNPKDKTSGPNGSVTVAQTKNLVNQVVHVSWKGFTPTTDGIGIPWANGPVRRANQPYYQVRVYQCRGADPKITDCYDSTLYNAPDPAAGFQQKLPVGFSTAPDFPSNMVMSVTGADGSGYADIELFTADQSPTLACDDKNPCSLVVEPNYGGDSLGFTDTTRKGLTNCADHSLDQALNLAGDQALEGNLNKWTRFKTGEQCSWDRRTVIPLSFAPTAGACPVQHSSFSAAGLEPLKRAMDQWQTGLCQGDSPMSLSYGFANGDGPSRTDFLAGGKDMALAARPDTQSPPPRPYVYAPVASTGISVVFVVDDPNTHLQIRSMKLNARLMAKLLTQSYNSPGDVPSVKGNPYCFFDDPEFKALNPVPAGSGMSWPTGCLYSNLSPTLFGGAADMTYQLTSWIASDPDAVRFLDGEPDPWGMHVDSFYLRPAFSGYPVDSFIRQDSSGYAGATTDPSDRWKSYEWNPVSTGLGDVVRKVLWNKPNCVNTDKLADGTHDLCPSMAMGRRTLFAVMDSGQAKAYSLPEAQLVNPAGGAVAPDGPGLQAAVADMTVDPATGMQSLPYGVSDSAFSHDQKAYPLTTVDYAMLPTKDVAADKVAAMSRFMRAVTTTGQVYGHEPGHLAPGFLALTAAQRTQAADAIGHLEAQDAKLPGNQAAPPNPPATGGDGSTPASGTGGGGQGAASVTQVGEGGAAGGTGGASTGGSGTGSGGAEAAGTAAGGAAGGAAATAAGAKPGATPSAPGKSLAAAPVAAGTPAADRSGGARLLLPIALIGGLVLLVGGPAALVLGGTPAGERLFAETKRGWARIRRRP